MKKENFNLDAAMSFWVLGLLIHSGGPVERSLSLIKKWDGNSAYPLIEKLLNSPAESLDWALSTKKDTAILLKDSEINSMFQIFRLAVLTGTSASERLQQISRQCLLNSSMYSRKSRNAKAARVHARQIGDWLQGLSLYVAAGASWSEAMNTPNLPMGTQLKNSWEKIVRETKVISREVQLAKIMELSKKCNSPELRWFAGMAPAVIDSGGNLSPFLNLLADLAWLRS